MSDSQKVQDKADKRAAALRDNLKKRKAFIKESPEASQKLKVQQETKTDKE